MNLVLLFHGCGSIVRGECCCWNGVPCSAVRVSAGITSGNVATGFSVLYGTFHFHRLYAWSAVVVTGVIGILIRFVGIMCITISIW